MQFEWDEAKNALNVLRHGFDFLDGIALFDAPHLKQRARSVGGEDRWLITGMIDECCVTLVCTLRGPDVVRFISLRRARYDEREAFYDRIGRRGP